MSRGTLFLGIGLMVGAAVVAAPAGGGGAEAQNAPATSVTCAFSNPSYSGWCRETRSIPDGGSGEQVCQGLLNCLNNTQCNETLCNATEIRSGWKVESVEVSGGSNP